MKKRDPITVALLGLITIGFYFLYWSVSTKNELNSKGAKIPTGWLIIIPFINIIWFWKYAKGVDQVTGQKISTGEAFLIMYFIALIGIPVIQNAYNKLDASPVPADQPLPTAAPPSETTMVPASQPPEDTGPSISPQDPMIQPTSNPSSDKPADSLNQVSPEPPSDTADSTPTGPISPPAEGSININEPSSEEPTNPPESQDNQSPPAEHQ